MNHFPGRTIGMMSVFGSPIFEWVLLVLIFAAGLAVRLYDLDDPPLDFHPTRQLHSAIIARGMYYQEHADLPEALREMAVTHWQAEGRIEPQVFERLVAWGYTLTGGPDLRVPRLFAIAFWLTAALFITALGARISRQGGGAATALFFLAWPYGVLASRAFQPDPLMVALLAAALWSALNWKDHPTWRWSILTGLLAGVAIFIKSTVVFFLAPPLVVIVLWNEINDAARSRLAFLGDPQVWVMALISVLPYAIYHIDGVYLRGYLVDQFSLRFFPNMWLDPAFYLRWLSNLERVVPFEILLLGLAGAFLVRRGLYQAVLLAMWAGYLLFGMTLPHHISTHDYYHLPLLLPVALGLSAMVVTGLENMRGPRTLVRAAAAGLLLAALLVWSYEARTALKRFDGQAQASMWETIGDQIGQSASVVALVPDYGFGLKYWAWISPQNWLTADEIRWRESLGQEFRFEAAFKDLAAGRDFFVIVPPEALESQPQLMDLLTTSYPVYRQNPDYLIFDLRETAQK